MMGVFAPKKCLRFPYAQFPIWCVGETKIPYCREGEWECSFQAWYLQDQLC